jgi:hypothetical protein
VIFDATNRQLGVIRYASPWPPTWWRRPTLEVLETSDDALLLTVRRGWLRRNWALRDADGQYVGTLLADALVDPFGLVFARRSSESTGEWRLQETTGREYARMSRDGDGSETLRFSDEKLTNPFLRMLVLGSFLLLQPAPPANQNGT